MTTTPAVRMRVYLTEGDHTGHEPTYRALVRLLRARGIAGATVFRGVLGYGRDSRIHAARALDLGVDLPVIVEVVDAADAIDAVMPAVLGLAGGAMVATESVAIHGSRS